jgi:hypothetical protein
MILLRRQCFEYQFCRDCDRRFQSPIDRAAVGEETVHAIRGVSVRFFRLQFQDDVDAANHEHVIFEFNFSDRFRH